MTILGSGLIAAGNTAAFSTDPYFSNQLILLHGEGTNGSTVFTDSSSYGRVFTPSGNVQISTAQSKGGSSSIYFDGTADYLSTPVDSDLIFGSTDLSFQAWVYPQKSGATVSIMGNARADGGGDYGIFLCYTSGSSGEFRLRNWLTTNGAFLSMNVSLNQWYYVLGVKQGSTGYIWVNGQAGTSGSLAATNVSHTSFLIGTTYNNSGFANDFQGYMDEIVVTKNG